MKRSRFVEWSVSIQNIPYDFLPDFRRLQNLYPQFDYKIAFQMESLVKNCVLLPKDVVSLESSIRTLLRQHGCPLTVRILQQFGKYLRLRTYETQSDGVDLQAVLDDATFKIRYKKPPTVDPNAAWIHRLDITPAAFYMEGPCWTGSNRFLRLFPDHHDYFLKVSFSEEDLTRIRHDREMDLSAVIKDRWRPTFKHLTPNRFDFMTYNTEDYDSPLGLKLAGREFDFLGFSSSSLREHSTWFMSPFRKGGELLTAEVLRSRLGEFREIRCPPRYAVRLGQTFTTTSHSFQISAEEVRKIPDVFDGTGQHIFSDGVGKISQEMINRIWKETIRQRNTANVKPVVYQIRLGGAKGVLSLDPTLKGAQICLRQSMIKFSAPNQTLELADSAKTLPLYLNRQLITILEMLGLRSENFIELKDIELAKVRLAARDYEEARQLLQRYGLGQSSRLSGILTALEQLHVRNVFYMPFFGALNRLAISHSLKQVKYRSRIAVDDSWTLMGVMDEFGRLGEREIYVCLRGDDASPVYLHGKTLVTRMPALHCGDVQEVHAIGEIESGHPLSALHNCIVFSSRGKRSVPNMLSGGDLDGDKFQVSQNPLLFPPTWDLPAEYPSVLPKDLDRDCTIGDIADFFVDFLVNDRTGQLAIMHLIHADQSYDGARNQGCIELSRLSAQAADFPKTGRQVDIKSAPHVKTRPKPDFMAERSLYCKEHDTQPNSNLYYRSEKAQGTLYRSVNIPKLLGEWDIKVGGNENGPREVWEEIKIKLESMDPFIQVDWHSYVDDAKRMFAAYMAELEYIEHAFHPRPWRDERLTEAEIFLQCLEMDVSTRRFSGRGRDDFMQGLRMEYSEVVDNLLSDISGSATEKFLIACACYYVGITESRKREDKEGESFAWLVVPDLVEAWKELEREHSDDEGGEITAISGFRETVNPYILSTMVPKEDGVDDTLRKVMGKFNVFQL